MGGQPALEELPPRPLGRGSDTSEGGSRKSGQLERRTRQEEARPQLVFVGHLPPPEGGGGCGCSQNGHWLRKLSTSPSLSEPQLFQLTNGDTKACSSRLSAVW